MSTISIQSETEQRSSAAALLRNDRGFRVVRIVLGLLLVTTAGLKLYGLNVTVLPRIGWFSQPIIQIAAIAWEFLLGIWLVSGALPRQARLASILTFLVFAQFTLILAINGTTDCGCFGSISANPWSVFVADIFVVIILCLTGARPKVSQHTQSRSARLVLKNPALHSMLVGTMLLTGTAIFGILRFGTLSVAFQRFIGFDVTAGAGYIDFGEAQPGTLVVRNIEVRNWSRAPIHVVGLPRNCLLSVRTDLPLTIPAGEARIIELVMRLPPKLPPGTLTFETTLWTDSDHARATAFRIGCRVQNQDAASLKRRAPTERASEGLATCVIVIDSAKNLRET